MRALVLLLLLLASTAMAEKKVAAPKDFWRLFVRPHKPWVLRLKTDKYDDNNKITVESYDIRKVGAADVARLRWTHKKGADSDGYVLDADDCKWTQVAVTDAGMYLFTAEDDDAKILAALAGKPNRSSPPKPYKATKTNGGRTLKVTDDNGEAMVCWGWETVGETDCDDLCFGNICATASKGVVFLEGRCAPDWFPYSR